MKLLIVGFGSVGKKYFEANKDYAEIFIYDPFIHKSQFSNLNFLTKDDLINCGNKFFNGVVICDYASTRLSSLNFTCQLANDFIILEKIITDKFSDIEGFNEIQKKCAPIFTHHRWGLLNLEDEIFELVTKHSLGSMLSFSSVAGNCCLSTGGSHWLGFYLSMLRKQSALSILKMDAMARIQFNSENPRNPALKILSGNISITNNEGVLDCHLNYAASSHVAPTQKLLCKFGYIEWQLNGECSIYRINQDVGVMKPWSYGIANKIHTSTLKSVGFDPFRICIQKASAGTGVPLSDGIDVVRLLIGSCIASIENKTIKLSELQNKIYDKYFDKNWGIT